MVIIESYLIVDVPSDVDFLIQKASQLAIADELDDESTQIVLVEMGNAVDDCFASSQGETCIEPLLKGLHEIVDNAKSGVRYSAEVHILQNKIASFILASHNPGYEQISHVFTNFRFIANSFNIPSFTTMEEFNYKLGIATGVSNKGSPASIISISTRINYCSEFTSRRRSW